MTLGQEVAKLCPAALPRVLTAIDKSGNRLLNQWDINTTQRRQMFFAQIAHESGRFRYLKELGGPTYFTKMYEGRKDLGNTQPGDGAKFAGRGLIQLTGRANYFLLSGVLSLDLINHPELAEDPTIAFEIACWFYHKKGCNQLADAGDFVRITRKINGGLNGFQDRKDLLKAIELNRLFEVKP